MSNKIWLSSPHMGGTELDYIHEAFDTNWVAPLGPLVNKFEERLIAYTGMPHCTALSAGTAALHLAMIILDVKLDDYVICQSKTFSASANPITYLGAKPVFIDSEKHSWNMCPEALKTALEDFDRKGEIKKVKAIVPVHLYGHPAKMPEILKLAEQYGIPVLEDAAEALGSKLNDISCGNFGEISILSFNGNKIITTSGGGAMLSRRKEYTDKALFLATQARDKAPHYEHTHIGYNYRLSNVLAGIGIGQMEVLDERVAARRANYNRYRNYFKKWEAAGYQLEWQEEAEGEFSNRWLSSFTIDPANNNGLTREKIRIELEKENIESRPLWKPMHMQPVFADCRYYGGNIAETLFDNGLCLPSGSNLVQEDFDRIFTELDKFIA